MTGERTPSAQEGSAPINWDALRDRIAALDSAMAQGFEPAADELQSLLRDRARVLAREHGPAESAEDGIEILEFAMAHERYGIETAHVDEVYPLESLTPLPCVQPFVLGIVNVRGRIVSLVDLKKFFGLPEKGLAELNRVIVLRSPTMEFGILADRIQGVRRVRPEGLENDFPVLKGIEKEYLKGVDPEGIIVLDGAAILSDPGIVVNNDEA